MQFTVDSVFNATEEVAAADSYPDIRVFTVGQSHYSDTVCLCAIYVYFYLFLM
jgi:hypothetical protein